MQTVCHALSTVTLRILFDMPYVNSTSFKLCMFFSTGLLVTLLSTLSCLGLYPLTVARIVLSGFLMTVTFSAVLL
jgi:hypothetical protein